MLNKVMLIGNLGKKPEIRFTPQGRATTRFPLATSETWTDQQGERQERTEWHNIVVWGKQAETCAEYLDKGRQVFIEGSIRTRQYDDPKDGARKWFTEVVAQRVQFMGSRDGGGAGARSGGGAGGNMGDLPPAGPEDDDIPF